ncbi:MAG: FecR domain-containing protein [Myxococcales bacterium]|nr:FecR domain-containing protein [Myxococcales bacterium]
MGLASVAASVAVGYTLAGRGSATAKSTRAFAGTLTKVIRSGDGAAQLKAKNAKGEEISLAEGTKIGPGTELKTDARARARIELDDGTVLALDRQTTVRFEAAPRTMRVTEGVVMADVLRQEGAPPAIFLTESGEVEVTGTKLALTATADRTSVEVLRGTVELKDGSQKVTVSAGQEGIAAKGAKLELAPVQGLAQRLAFGEGLGKAMHNEDGDLPVSGLGELRAKKPGKSDEKDRAVRLSNHKVKVRIAGGVARTEIDEVFSNDSDDELEGIYRFPLPPGAQIERLALEVDGKLLDGSFVDKAKGAAIWRGVIQNAAPKTPKPKEEIFWVPGPWRDPALLEWKRGGRFELKIFPIPKRGSRRIVIAYTENLAPVAGVRRYTYPLPQSTASELRIGNFDLDLQVLGSDPKKAVRPRGYELKRAGAGPAADGAGERFAMAERDFVPTGDLTVEYALADRASDVTAWGYTSNEGGTPESYAALALRPKFSTWGETKPRDVVLVVDSGRSMFGERYQRAKRLAVQIAQELDRRDRVTVLACDISCREAPGGLVNAGGQTAKGIADFLSGIEPDGATDLVGALRRAASRRDASRDARVILITDGVVGAGYRTPERVMREAKDALGDARTALVAVPIGADADVRLLEGVARAGGGLVVPYAPGQTLEGTAVDVVTASYGAGLRDVEVTLPEGLADVAPRALPSIRPGGELVLAAKMTRENVRGDVVLRGRVAGQPFEAKYPVDLRASTNAGNAFVPRVFAAARIADMDDRARTDAERAEVVKLSQRFSVPSRHTSLLVLESEAMFKAFGIDRNSVAPTWTGEESADATTVATLATGAEDLGGSLGGLAANGYGDKDNGPKGAAAGFGGAVASRATRDEFAVGQGAPAPKAPAPAAESEARPSPIEEAKKSKEDSAQRERAAQPSTAPTMAPPLARRPPRPPNFGRGQWMKRIFVRHANISQTSAPPVTPARVTAARAAAQAAPDERNKHRDLARLLSANGALDELGDVLARWSARDPMDADATAMRADLAARGGDRTRALRVLSGVAAAGQADTTTLEALAQSHERAGDQDAACAFRVSVGEQRVVDTKGILTGVDVERVGRALACEERVGRGSVWLSDLKDPAAVEAAARKAKTDVGRESLRGDIVVEATWDASAGADIDLAILDPNGQRYSWVSRSKNVRALDPTSRTRETLALASSGAGPFTLELARAAGQGPVRVQLTVRALGEQSSFPVVLSGPVSTVGRVQVRFDEEFIPVPGPTGAPFEVFR